MTSKFIVEQVQEKVKQVFGKLELSISSRELISPYGLFINEVKINSLSGGSNVLKVHDFELNWEHEDDDTHFGNLSLDVSLQITTEESLHILAANYLINETNAYIQKVTVQTMASTREISVNDFLIEWTGTEE